MRTSFFLRLLTQTACFLVSLGLAYTCQAAEKSPDLEAVRSRVREYLSSIQSIDMQFHHWTTMGLDGKQHESECGPSLVEWAEQGAQKLIRQGPFPNEGYPPIQTDIRFDGQTGYYVAYQPSDGILKIESVYQTPQISHGYRLGLFFSPAIFYGRLAAYSNGTLLDLLSSPAARVIAREEIKGAPCVHLEVANVRGMDDMLISYNVWLDEQKDYLPRLAVTKIVDHTPKFAQLRDSEWRYEIREFLEVADALIGKKRWFPAEMSHVDPHVKWRLKVLSITLNHQLPAVKFRPEIPAGTLVYDGDQIPNSPVKSFIAGGKDTATALIDQRLKDSAHLPSPSGPLIDAREEGSVNWTVLFGGLCFLVLMVAAIWRFAIGRS